MKWASAGDFWAMGGYGFYVWGSYGAVIVVIVIELWLLRARRRRAEVEAALEIKRSANVR